MVDFTNTTNSSNTGLGLGNQLFNQDNQQYFTTFRLDATLTQKVRLFGSWLYQYSRESGDSLPNPDSTTGLANTGGLVVGQGLTTGINAPITQYAHGLGFFEPRTRLTTSAPTSH